MSISLIANSGIQFHKFTLSIDSNADVLGTMGFHEREDLVNAKISLEHAYYLPDQDYWVPKQVLRIHDYLDENDRILDKINSNLIKTFRLIEDKDYFTISDIQTCLDFFASGPDSVKWIPIPYFKKNTDGKGLFGPIAWARMMIKEKEEEKQTSRNTYRQAKQKNYHVVLTFDTSLDIAGPVYYAPSSADTADNENCFILAANEDLLLNFCNAQYGCDWVEQYIKTIVSEGKEVSGFPYMKHIGYYVFFIKYLAELKVDKDADNPQRIFPEVSLYTDLKPPIDVDLVLDIGNSNTCGILFESPGALKKAKKLKINDLSQPELDYSDPFSMRLVFMDSRFGDIVIPEHRNFKWPSLLRLGNEASRLISQYNINTDRGTETATHHSSPKRYLWDSKKSEIPWEFINFSGKNFGDAIYYEGISQQFKADGEYAYDGNFSFSPHYSRKSLMTFVFIEILLQAISQVNSYEFRYAHGNPEKPRKIKRITITCPTSIIQKEQIILRECAETATRTLKRFFSDTFLGKYEEDELAVKDLEIVPSPKDLARKLDQLAFRKDWIYDEATCGQFVFLYAEISERYRNEANTFFNLFGKYRNDVSNPDKKSLTIGSIDIGGGTTDLMICAYQSENESGQGLAVIKPHPLYWESFSFAGDDLLKELVQQILLDGSVTNQNNLIAEQRMLGTVGIIRNAAIAAGVKNVAEKMLNFFGPDSNRQGYIARLQRKNFIVQIAVPIATHYLQHAIEEKADETVLFSHFFPVTKPNSELIEYFNNAFAPLKLEAVQFKLSKSRVFDIVETTFDPLLKQLSGILAAYGIDYLLLAGKPTTLPKIRDLFIKYYPVSPERIISLNKNKYRVGGWYPFANELGYIEDPKTIVSVGALIALMAGKLNRLGNFRIKTELLQQQLISTADYMGVLNQYTQLIETALISPEENASELEVHSLPMKLGYKQLPNKSYRAKPIYKLEFNEEEIKKRIIEQNPSLADHESKLQDAIQDYKVKLEGNMPFRIKLQRNLTESKENLVITRVLDAGRNERSKQLFCLNIMTLADEYNYWLDSGEFMLNLR